MATWERPLNEAEVEAILVEMRAGVTVSIGATRSHDTFLFQDGAWYVESFDEGHSRQHPSSEAAVRELISWSPGEFLFVLKAPHMRACRVAYLDGRFVDASRHLGDATAYGDELDEGRVLCAFLAWPGVRPGVETVKTIRRKLEGHTAYHAFMGLMGWERTPEVGRRGAAFADTLMEIAGEAPGCFELRGAFRELAGDLDGAVEDLERERACTPQDSRYRGHLLEQINRLRHKGEEP